MSLRACSGTDHQAATAAAEAGGATVIAAIQGAIEIPVLLIVGVGPCPPPAIDGATRRAARAANAIRAPRLRRHLEQARATQAIADDLAWTTRFAARSGVATVRAAQDLVGALERPTLVAAAREAPATAIAAPSRFAQHVLLAVAVPAPVGATAAATAASRPRPTASGGRLGNLGRLGGVRLAHLAPPQRDRHRRTSLGWPVAAHELLLWGLAPGR